MGKPVSMTGFGRGTASGRESSWTVELRSVNHRYLDISIKLPRRFLGWDDKIKKEISSIHNRGRIDIFITFNDDIKTLFINSVLNDNDSIIELTFKPHFFIVGPYGLLTSDCPLLSSFPCTNFLSPQSASLMAAQKFSLTIIIYR